MNHTQYGTQIDGAPYLDKITTDFINLLPPLNPEVKELLEIRLLATGILDPIIIWAKNTNDSKYVLVYGQPEFEIAKKNGLPFKVIIMTSESKEEVIRFILEKHLYRIYLNLFQRGLLVLTHKELYKKKGKQRMSLAGQGFKLSENLEPHDTMKILAKMAGCCHTTLRQIESIESIFRKNPSKYSEVKEKLEKDEKYINTAFKFLCPQKAKNPYSNESALPTIKITQPEAAAPEDPGPVYSISKENVYDVVYIQPNWDLSDSIRSYDPLIDELKRLNISGMTYDRFTAAFILVPSKYMMVANEIAQHWGFIYKDCFTVITGKRIFQSRYANHVHLNLMLFEKKGVEIPQLSEVDLRDSKLDENQIFDFIDGIFQPNSQKAGIFTEEHQGWDTYDIDKASKQLIKNSKLAAA